MYTSLLYYHGYIHTFISLQERLSYKGCKKWHTANAQKVRNIYEHKFQFEKFKSAHIIFLTQDQNSFEIHTAKHTLHVRHIASNEASFYVSTTCMNTQFLFKTQKGTPS